MLSRPRLVRRYGLLVLVAFLVWQSACQGAEHVPPTAPAPAATATLAPAAPEARPTDVLRAASGLATVPTPTAVPTATRPAPTPTEVGADSRSQPPAPRIGRRAPEFTLRTPTDGTVNLSDLRGKTVLLNFWATWCGPCQQEMPDLETTYQEFRASGLLVVGVNQGESALVVQRWLDQKKVTFPIVLDGDGNVTLKYQVFGLPASFLIDADGVIRDRKMGTLTREQMVDKVRQTQTSTGKPLPAPVSIANSQRSGDEIAAVVGERRLTLRDVDRRLDLDLALDRLESGAQPDLSSDGELRRTRVEVLQSLVEEELLVRAARAAGLTVPSAEVDEEVERLGSNLARSRYDFSRELGRNGVTVDFLREVLERGLLANRFVDAKILSATSPDPRTAFNEWLKAELERVKPDLRLR
ncbi:MAG: redoxin domain-containing protein [Chloroflexi bacterium]|nr:redoxin domain-containing protein [Chloroflexota bacterium]